VRAVSPRWRCGLFKLGIVPEHIEPGKPQQNGRHERMHRTLKQETAAPPAGTRRAQQRRFDHFREEYNEQRPHQALNQNPPASYYHNSPRTYPERLREPDYPPTGTCAASRPAASSDGTATRSSWATR